jgi:hypothetical protein
MWRASTPKHAARIPWGDRDDPALFAEKRPSLGTDLREEVSLDGADGVVASAKAVPHEAQKRLSARKRAPHCAHEWRVEEVSGRR